MLVGSLKELCVYFFMFVLLINLAVPFYNLLKFDFSFGISDISLYYEIL